MTRSIFDPTGPDTERSGNTFLGEDAANRKHMPESAIDGKAGASARVDPELTKAVEEERARDPEDGVEPGKDDK